MPHLTTPSAKTDEIFLVHKYMNTALKFSVQLNTEALSLCGTRSDLPFSIAPGSTLNWLEHSLTHTSANQKQFSRVLKSYSS